MNAASFSKLFAINIFLLKIGFSTQILEAHTSFKLQSETSLKDSGLLVQHRSGLFLDLVSEDGYLSHRCPFTWHREICISLTRRHSRDACTATESSAVFVHNWLFMCFFIIIEMKTNSTIKVRISSLYVYKIDGLTYFDATVPDWSIAGLLPFKLFKLFLVF